MVVFIHASPAAVAPLTAYYAAHADDLAVTHLLDDGLLRLLGEGDVVRAAGRFAELLRGAARWYGARVGVLTCSAVPHGLPADLHRETGLPVLKIDDPLASAGVRFARPGVLVTFPPALVHTRALLQEAAAREGFTPQLRTRVVEGAYDALRAGDHATHDRLLIAAAEALAGEGADALLLSQVSMARVQQALTARVPVPVLSSLSTSVAAVRAALEEAR